MIEPNTGPRRLKDMQASAEAHPPATPTAPELVAIGGRSFDAFYETHYHELVRALSVTLGDAAWGRDAADEAMTRAYERWGTVQGYANPAGWAYRVGLNWARSWHRKLARRLPWHEIVTIEAKAADPELDDALRSLDAKYRAVVVCRYLLDWSTDQTADALGIKAGTVKSRLSAGLRRLRDELGESRPDNAPDIVSHPEGTS